MNLALDPDSEEVIQRELDRGHFTTPAEVVASALLLLNSQEDWLQENKDAINARLELSFEQSRNGETYSPEDGCQLLAERILSQPQRENSSCLRAWLQPCHKSLKRQEALVPGVRFESPQHHILKSPSRSKHASRHRKTVPQPLKPGP